MALSEQPEEPDQAGEPDGAEASVRRAAQVPLERDNNDEVIASLHANSTAGEWMENVKKHPELIGVQKPTTEEIGVALRSACELAPESPVAVDALTRGLL